MNKTSKSMNIGIVSQYPPPHSKHARQSGIASYTLNQASAIKNQGCNVSIFCNKINGVSSHYNENDININRCWDIGTGSCFQILQTLARAKKNLDLVHIQYSYALFGGSLSALFFPLLLLFLRLSNIKFVITLHELLPLSIVNKKFLDEAGVKGNPAVFKTGIFQLVRLIILLSNAVIVHESYSKSVIQTEYRSNPQKIHVIPHGIEEFATLKDQEIARKLLGIKQKRVLLFFGYLAKYKGLSNLVDACARLNSDYILLIAGGEHPRLKGKREYQDYLSRLHQQIACSRAEVRFTGFVDEADIPTFFAAADVLLLPYTRLISASGPLALCVAHKKPFLAADSLAGAIDESDILFPNTAEGIRIKVERFFLDEDIRDKSLKYGKKLLENRIWSRVASDTTALYKNIISARKISLQEPRKCQDDGVLERIDTTEQRQKTPLRG